MAHVYLLDVLHKELYEAVALAHVYLLDVLHKELYDWRWHMFTFLMCSIKSCTRLALAHVYLLDVLHKDLYQAGVGKGDPVGYVGREAVVPRVQALERVQSVQVTTHALTQLTHATTAHALRVSMGVVSVWAWVQWVFRHRCSECLGMGAVSAWARVQRVLGHGWSEYGTWVQ